VRAERRLSIAVVGTGVSGLVAARRLDRNHDVSVFEADTRIGGHVNTIDVTVDGRDYAVDTGFIVYNERNYPQFTRLLRELGVTTQPTDMSFGVSDEVTGLEYCGTNLNTLFAQRRNLLRPSYLRLLTEIAHFNRAARGLVADEPRWGTGDRLPTGANADQDDEEESIAAFVDRHGYSDAFRRQFLVPFGASIWSADPKTFTDFPIRAYARFMHNHGLLELRDRPRWRTITGGSRRYVDALVAPFTDRIRVASPVHKIVSRDTGVEVLTDRGPETFDRVVLAVHSDQALRLLGDATADERAVLGAIGYQRNTATLHTDPTLLPTNPRARASWNYAVDGTASGRATVTYWMNRLQSIECPRPLLVTLNRRGEIDDRHVLAEIEYHHPVFDVAATTAQRARQRIQGVRDIFFAGAYWGYGFHEDGVQSALEVVGAIEAAA
jgi:predicted NAD/FAD-binding protein